MATPKSTIIDIGAALKADDERQRTLDAEVNALFTENFDGSLMRDTECKAAKGGIRVGLIAARRQEKATTSGAPLTCPHCLDPLVESEGVEGQHGNLWHSTCLDSWREEP